MKKPKVKRKRKLGKANPRKGWAKQIAQAIKKHGQPKPFWPDDLKPGEESDWTW